MKKKLLSMAIGLSVCLASFGSFASDRTLDELANMKYEGSKSALEELTADQASVRNTAQMEAALATGAQHGYLMQMKALKIAILEREVQLDKIYDFNSLMKVAFNGEEELYLLPPVIKEANDVVSVADNARQMRISGKIWLIDKPERLVTAAPNWRQYLVFDQPVEVSDPPTVLLPRSPEEMMNWGDWVTMGWEAGMRQADREMQRRSVNLGEDFIGMVKYLQLQVEGKVSTPMVVSSVQEVSGGGSQMREFDKVIQLSSPARLNTKADEWKAIPVDTRESYRMPIERNDYDSPMD